MLKITLINHDINLDFSTSDIKRTLIKQDTNQTHSLTIKLYDNNGRIKLDTNWQYTISCRKADNTFIVNSNNISVSSNTIYVEITKQMTSCPGTEKCELLIQDGSQTLYSGTFYLYIEANVNYGSALESTNEYDSLSDTLNQMREYEKESEKVKDHIQDISTNIDATYDELTEAVNTTNGLIEKNEDIEANEDVRKKNETNREANERKRQTDTANAIKNANDAADNANSKANDLQNKLDSHYFALTEDLQTHNSSSTAHDDMRNLISDLTTRLNALADSDDTTLDQLSEIVAYIKNNKSLIDNVTTSKINVSDIIDSLTSTAVNKPLSAKQGKVIKDLMDTLTTTLGNKVDKVSGKGLSTNDYTTAEKNKLSSIAAGAEANVQVDWNETNTSSDSFIRNKPSLDGKVSKTGDIMSGELVLKNGSMVAREIGTSGVYGYVKMVQLKILRQYIDYPIIFEIAGRRWTSSNKLYVKFESDSGSDPQLNSFLIDKTAPYKVAMVKSGTSTWDIYMQKSESYGACAVCSMSNTNYADAVQITFPDTLVSTLPSGAVEPTVITWDKAKNADTVDGKHFSDIQELINNKQNIRNDRVVENYDWNNATTAGAYKVQYATMTNDKHGIPGEYSYGILYVIDSEVGGETRILQMYFPHQPNISPIHIRMRNNGIWRDWVAVTSAIGATGNAATLGGMNKNQFVHRANPVLDGNVTCKKNIWFSGENGANTMIMFLDSGDNTGQGISIGGGGLTIIGGGESAGVIANYYTNNGDVKAGGNENMIVANDGVIDFYTNCQSGFSGAKHITMNTDGTITALGLNGNATSASCVLDGGDKRKTYMKYSANCVNDFTYLAVWNPISGGVELRAFEKANLKDKLGLSNTPDYEEGTWSPRHGYTADPTHFVFDYGKYTKIGNIVIASFGMSASPVSGEYYVYLSQSSLPWPMSATNFMSAEVHDVFNGKKYDGRMSGVISTINFGKMQFTKQTSSAPTERYVGTIMYRI